MDCTSEDTFNLVRRLNIGLEVPSSALGRLGASLRRTELGVDLDLRTPLFDGRSRSDIVEDLASAIGSGSYLSLRTLDFNERKKVGPLSIMLPFKDRLKDIEKYWSQDFYPVGSSLEVATQCLLKLIPKASLRPHSFSAAFNLMPKDTNLGLPLMTRDRGSAYLYRDRAECITSVDDVYPAVIGWRGQSSGFSIPKQRVVWQMDHAETILGATVMTPMLNALRQIPGFSAWSSSDTVDLALTKLIKFASVKGLDIFSFDYSEFDSSIGYDIMERIWYCMENWFHPELLNRFNILLEVFSTLPLIVPWNVMRGRRGGVPSGSVMTNLFDSLANLLVGFYISDRIGLPLYMYEVMGDDSVFVFDGKIDMESISDVANELGLSLSADKSMVSDHVAHYLQRLFDDEYQIDGMIRGVRTPFRAITGMLSFERLRQGWSKYLTSARLIMQIENCKWDPRFPDFVRFCVSGDELLSCGIDPVEIFRRAGGAAMVSAALGLTSFPFNVSDPKGVETFRSVGIIRGLT